MSLDLIAATSTLPGLATAGTQTMGGDKTFTGSTQFLRASATAYSATTFPPNPGTTYVNSTNSGTVSQVFVVRDVSTVAQYMSFTTYSPANAQVDFVMQSTLSGTTKEILRATGAGAWTWGPANVQTTHTLHGVVNVNAATNALDAYIQFQHVGVAKGYIGSNGTTGTSLITGLTEDFAVAIVGIDSIGFSGNTGTTLHGKCSQAGVWTFTNSATNSMILTGGATVASRLQLNRGTDDANQYMEIGWSSITSVRANGLLSGNQTNLSFQQRGSDGTRVVGGYDVAGAWFFGNPSAAAQGITLQGNDAGYTATALKYYQQGTFNPSINFGGGNGTRTYSSTGYYTRIGNLCHFQAFISAIVVGTASGGASINLPFASANSSNLYGTCVIGLTNGVSVISQGNINPNDTNCALLKADGVTGVATTDFGGSSYFTITISYIIA